MLSFCGPLAVIVILVAEVSTLVPPPENVTVSCNNFQTVVYWNYSEQHQHPLFDLKIKGDYLFEEISDIKQHHYDLSSLIWPAKELDNYFVNLTAKVGTEISTHQESIKFTFNKFKTAPIKCKLDFPAVNLSLKDGDIEVEFHNPYHLYPELKEVQNNKQFEYKVMHGNTPRPFKCTKTICQEPTSFVFMKEEQYCVSLEGMDGRLDFQRTGQICISPTEDDDQMKILSIILPMIFFVLIIILIRVIIIICKKNVQNEHFPKTLVLILTNPHDKNIMHLPQEIMSHISSIEPAISASQSLLDIQEDEDSPGTGYDRGHAPLQMDLEMGPGDVVVGYGHA
ncbi:hypothetical protein UPYG_G00066250 [Umbra pygmaea]|uniref:Fibronectin type-III domain-containing protein n=1 Tax=Umbra pygmaea TaxID=75934 RepID=A0ABD0XV79_UMBPY